MQLHMNLMTVFAVGILIIFPTPGQTASIMDPENLSTTVNDLLTSTEEQALQTNSSAFALVNCTARNLKSSEIKSIVTLIMSRSFGPTETDQTPNVNTAPSVPSTLNGLSIESSDEEIVPGVTDFLSLECTYNRPDKSDAMSVVSLRMYRWDEFTHTSQDLLSLTSFYPDKVIVQHDMGAKVTGLLNQTGESLLSLSWNNPNKKVATHYGCVIITINSVGQPETSEVQLEITTRNVDISILVESLRNVKTTLEQEKALNLAHEETLKEHEREIKNLTQVLEMERAKNVAQQNVQTVLSSTLEQNEETLKEHGREIKNLTQVLEMEQAKNVAQQNVQTALSSTLEQGKALNLAQDETLKEYEREIKNLTHGLEQERAKNVAQQKIINELDLFQEYGFKVTGFQFDNQFLYWSSKWLTFQEAKTACTETGGKLAEFDFSILKSYETYLKESGMTPTGGALWVGLTRSDASSPWVWASNGTQPGSITWHSQPSSNRHCAWFYPIWNGYHADQCTDTYRAFCSRNV